MTRSGDCRATATEVAAGRRVPTRCSRRSDSTAASSGRAPRDSYDRRWRSFRHSPKRVTARPRSSKKWLHAQRRRQSAITRHV
jgi:hypothetical protein